MNEKAKNLAMKKHEGQVWGKYPYSEHLLRVVEEVKKSFDKLNLDEKSKNLLIDAAWLHDAVEDTDLTLAEVELEFSKELSELVNSVTDEPGVNRKERKKNTYLKTSKSKLGVFLKLCDRKVNVTHSKNEKSSHFQMYQKEHSEMKKALDKYPELDFLWLELDELLK